MTPDFINGMFELIGAGFTLSNAIRVVKDRGYAGINVWSLIFFTSWGFWNLFFYPHLDQWWSFLGGVALVLSNTLWLFFMVVYGRKHV